MASPKYVFVSYAREDASFADKVRNWLRGKDIATWQDLHNIKAGQPWLKMIDDGLQNAAAVIVVITPKSLKSAYVTYEWAFAIGAGRLVIPLVAHGMDPAKLPPRLSALNGIEMAQRQSWKQLRKAVPFPPRKRVAPKICARFDMEDGQPRKNKDGYAIEISVHAAPKTTKAVVYQILDEGKNPLELRSESAATQFTRSIRADGDVSVTATIRMAKDALTIESELSAALRRGYRGRALAPVSNAIEQIANN